MDQKIRDGVTKIQQSDEFRNYLITMAQFHSYSWHNQLLIMMQRPDATMVKGFNAWKELDRHVKKGETGIMILAPRGPTSETRWVRPADGATWVIRKMNGQWGAYRNDRPDNTFRSARAAAAWLRSQGAIPHRETVDVRSFKDVYVFDIKQTEGKPIPQFEVPVLSGEAKKDLLYGMLNLMQKEGVQVDWTPKPDQSPTIKGYYRSPNLIWVKPDEPPAQRLKTLIHEAAHHYTAGPFRLPREDAETIAECAAFVVGAHHGFDTGVRSFPYVAIWARDQKTLDKNLEAVHNVSEHIIEKLEDVGLRSSLKVEGSE